MFGKNIAISMAVTVAAALSAGPAAAQDSSGPANAPAAGRKPAPTKNDPGLGEPSSDADKAADSANSAAVGTATQNSNQAGAVKADKDAVKADKAAEKKKNATKKGAANMQGGANPDQGSSTGDDIATGVRDVTLSTDRGGQYRPFAVELNPLGLFVGGRFSISAEWVPATHHAIIVSPHIVHTTSDIATSPSTTQSQAFTGFGGEIGYRYYTGHRGMNGIFVGPSVLVGFYNAGLPSGNQPFSDIGLAADVGLQQIFFQHLVVGGGVGLEYLSVNHDFHDLPTGPAAIASSGVKPRLLLSAGYGF